MSNKSEPHEHSISCPRGQLTLLPQQGYEVRYQARNNTVGFAFDCQTGDHAYGCDRIQPFLAKPNALAFVPEGCDVYSRSDRGGEYLLLSLEHTDDKLAAPEAVLPNRQFNNVQDNQALKVATALRRLLLTGLPICELEVACLTQELMGHVERVLLNRPEQPMKSWMASRRFSLIEEMVEESLDQKITVSMLANYLQLSEGFFHRAFQASVGQSPYEFILQRRLARARELVSCTDRPLAEVAFEVGFSSHAHMATAFKKRLGISPSVLRNR